jgi:hypothetical protein
LKARESATLGRIMTHKKPLIPVFAATLFTSAFLIFSVQPIIGKLLLPLLGGTPAVWNTAMVFFQAMLLLGYSYAHLTARFLSLRVQASLHIALLALFFFVLPIALPEGYTPPGEGNQQWWQITAMALMVGGPFFVLAASAPLFQHWFSATEHPDAQNPYFLYAVSNAGSMLALLSYPFVIEPMLSIPEQSIGWTFGYLALIALTFLCATLIWNGKKPALPFVDVRERDQGRDWKIRAAWVGLAFIPSSLMLGITTYIVTDIASIPLLWLIPLAIYLMTFIVAFAPADPKKPYLLRHIATYTLIAVILLLAHDSYKNVSLVFIIVHVIAFAIFAQLCHSQLAHLKPSPARLTEYYLLISLGGVLGGSFNALAAPILFNSTLEYPLVLAAVAFVIWMLSDKTENASLQFNTINDKSRRIKLLILDGMMLGVGIAVALLAMQTTQAHLLMLFASAAMLILILLSLKNLPVFALYCTFLLLSFQHYSSWSQNFTLLEKHRNYFGTLRVFDYGERGGISIVHGTTTHGIQYTDEKRRLTPTTYYSPIGPAGDIFFHLNKNKNPNGQKVAALGLGVGSINCYGWPKRSFDFYEIDADIVKIAQNPKYFTYLSDCTKDHRIILGDARLKIAQAENAYYDLIFIDTFSSDSIPVHIITKEAIQTYLKKLRPGGLIAIHISNRYFDLRIPIDAAVKDLGLRAAFKTHTPFKRIGTFDSHTAYILIGRSDLDLAHFMEMETWVPLTAPREVRPWTDDYANIFPAFYFMSKLQ